MEPFQCSPVDSVRQIESSQRFTSSGSMNPRHHGSTPFSPSTLEHSQQLPPPTDVIESNREMHNNRDLPVERIKPSKRLNSPGHHGSTSSSPPPMEPFQPVDSVHPSTPMDAIESMREICKDPIEQIRPFKRFKSSDSMNHGNYGCTPFSTSTMKHYQPSPVDSVDPPPTDVIESNRETHEKEDPVEGFRSSGSVNPVYDVSIPSSSSTMESFQPSLLDAIQSLREMCQKIYPIEEIDGLFSVVEKQLYMMNPSTEVGSSSAQSWLETVWDCIKHAVKTIQIISTETENLSESVGVEIIGSLTELLSKILQLVIEVKPRNEQMRDERGKPCNAVGTIVEGAVVCNDFLNNLGKSLRLWSATRRAAQLVKTIQKCRDEYVFLCHSGKQKNFVRQLHKDLTRARFSCFFDENSLPLAQKFPSVIFEAVKTCKIAVLVLSHEFIRSKWPMLELSKFIKAMKSGENANLKLLPIFFMVDPKELSHITKDCQEWQNLNVSDVERDEWQNAIKEIRPINGLVFRKDGNEVEFIDRVVEKISSLICPVSHRLLLEIEPVGIEEQVHEVKELLAMEDGEPALAVLVCGFGGVGKSTVAGAVVQSLCLSSTNFKFCRVKIEETQDRTSQIIKLQKDIIYYLGGGKVELQDLQDGRDKIKESLKNKWSFLFIDNVVDNNYIKGLLPQDFLTHEQKTKLRIIITSSEKNVKAEINIKWKEYTVKPLSDVDSKSLLSKTILSSQEVGDIDLDEEKRMIDEVASECRGVPHLLSVFGKHLRGERIKDSYQEALDVIRDGNLDSYRSENLGKKLMFMYNNIIDVEVKEAFLDICTYYNVWKWDLVRDIVDNRTLEDLHRRMLVSKSSSDEVIVHDILRLMGMKEARFTRFSNYEDLSDALEDNLDGFDLKDVKGISLLNDWVTIKSTQLEAMHQCLRVLMLGDRVTLDGPPCQRACRNLRYLHVGDIKAFPFEDTTKLKKLRVIHNRSKPGMNLTKSHFHCVKRIFHEEPYVECDELEKLPFQNLNSLKTSIVIARKSVEFPEELGHPAFPVDPDFRRSINLQRLPKTQMECTPSEITKSDSKHCNSLQNFINSLCSEDEDVSETYGQSQSQYGEGQSKNREFIQALKVNRIEYLLIEGQQIRVDDLLGKAISFILCDFKLFEFINVQQIYKDLQQDSSNFIAIWIPAVWPEGCGLGSYTRLIPCMPWPTFPHPQLVNVKRKDPRFVVLDKGGQIANQDALPLLLGWGLKLYPFTQRSIRDSFSLMNSESSLEFLLHGMNIVGRKPMRFLYAERPHEWHKMKCNVEELTQIHDNFEILYVGKFNEHDTADIEIHKEKYEDAIQKMCWPSFSFPDMIMFWYRCKYLASKQGYELSKEANITETVHRLAHQLYSGGTSVVLVDNNGPVTCRGYDLLQMICESSDEISEGEGMAIRMVKQSLSRGECNAVVKAFFRDEIDDLPQHSHHRIISYSGRRRVYTCGVCGCGFRRELEWNEQRSYSCDECEWDMCGRCWMAYATQQVQKLASTL